MKKVISLFLALVMLATSVVGMGFSAQAQVKSNKNLQVITDGDDGNGYPVAILMDGNLYRVNCKSNDGKQKAKLTKLASNVVSASGGYCGGYSEEYKAGAVGYTKDSWSDLYFFILWLDKNKTMHSYYYLLAGGGNGQKVNDKQGTVYKKGKGPTVKNVDKISSVGYVKNKKLYVPYKTSDYAISFREMKVYKYYSDRYVSVNLSGNVTNTFGNYFVASGKTYGALGFESIVFPYSLKDAFRCKDKQYIAIGKKLYLYNTDKKTKKLIASDFASHGKNGYYTTSGKFKSLKNKSSYYAYRIDYIDDGEKFATVTKDKKLVIATAKYKNYALDTNNMSIKSIIASNVKALYTGDFDANDLCAWVYSNSFYYTKYDNSFWVYDLNTKKSTCLAKKPKSSSIKTLSAKKKGFYVSWKKASSITGYQIQYATNSKFTSNKKTVTVQKRSTTHKTITKLKAKKKYYVRIRTYKTINGTKYYSSWSKYKTVTTKR